MRLTPVSHMNIVSGKGLWYLLTCCEPIRRQHLPILTNQKTGYITFLNWIDKYLWREAGKWAEHFLISQPSIVTSKYVWRNILSEETQTWAIIL